VFGVRFTDLLGGNMNIEVAIPSTAASKPFSLLCQKNGDSEVAWMNAVTRYTRLERQRLRLLTELNRASDTPQPMTDSKRIASKLQPTQAQPNNQLFYGCFGVRSL